MNQLQFKTDRALESEGKSSQAIYLAVAKLINSQSGKVVDFGWGQGAFCNFLDLSKQQYIGIDLVRYPEFPQDCEFIESDLDSGEIKLPDNYAEIVCAIETIEYLENPRALMRELVRITKPGGLLIVTTPNQLSLLSKLTLIFKNQFNAFQATPGCYPAHITALLEIDLVRIAAECQLTSIEIHYTNYGRIPGTSRSYPQWLGFRGRLFSDNVGFFCIYLSQVRIMLITTCVCVSILLVILFWSKNFKRAFALLGIVQPLVGEPHYIVGKNTSNL